MEKTLQDEVREIKKSLRLSMNGIVSTLQRRQGLDYKINFGVEIPRLKSIAAQHAKNKELATTLWQDDIRECKMLAIFLMPQEGYAEVAEKWTGEANFTEIADLLAMYLLSNMPDALDSALKWTVRNGNMYRYCGYQTISHLLRRGTTLNEEQEKAFFISLATLPNGEGHNVTTHCAHNAALRYLDNTPDAVQRLREAIGNSQVNLTALLDSLED